jgi:hypothetical protein
MRTRDEEICDQVNAIISARTKDLVEIQPKNDSVEEAIESVQAMSDVIQNDNERFLQLVRIIRQPYEGVSSTSSIVGDKLLGPLASGVIIGMGMYGALNTNWFGVTAFICALLFMADQNYRRLHS